MFRSSMLTGERPELSIMSDIARWQNWGLEIIFQFVLR